MKTLVSILIVVQSILNANAYYDCIKYVSKCEKHELVKTVDWSDVILPSSSSYYSYSFHFIYSAPYSQYDSTIVNERGMRLFDLGVFENNDTNEQVVMDGKRESIITQILKTRCETEREIYLELMEISKNSERCN